MDGEADKKELACIGLIDLILIRSENEACDVREQPERMNIIDQTTTY